MYTYHAMISVLQLMLINFINCVFSFQELKEQFLKFSFKDFVLNGQEVCLAFILHVSICHLIPKNIMEIPFVSFKLDYDYNNNDINFTKRNLFHTLVLLSTRIINMTFGKTLFQADYLFFRAKQTHLSPVSLASW